MKTDLFAAPFEGVYQYDDDGLWLHPDSRRAFGKMKDRVDLFQDWMRRRGFEVVSSQVVYRSGKPYPKEDLSGWTLAVLQTWPQPVGIWVRRRKLPPCPFCGGTPTPFVKGFSQAGARRPGECVWQAAYGADGLMAEASVYCHDCGVEGPIAEETIFVGEDYYALLLEGVRLWTERDQRNGHVYALNAAEGRCCYPRRDAV